jgi:hypothetical protein
MTVRGGVKYRRGHGISLVKESSLSAHFDGPTLAGSANVLAYLSVEPSLFIYDLMGPGLKNQPGLGLNAAVTSSADLPQCYDMSCALTGSVDGDFYWSLKGRLAKLLGLSKLNDKVPDFRIFHLATDLTRVRYNPCSDNPAALKVIGDIAEVVMLQNTTQDRSATFTIKNNNLTPGYPLPWSVQVIPDDGHVVVPQRAGQLDAGAETAIQVQVANTAALSPGKHTTRIVFKNTASQNAAAPATVEKYVKVRVLEPLLTPVITYAAYTAPSLVRIDWAYGGNVEYLDGFRLAYAANVDGLCPDAASTGWGGAGWADRAQRSITIGVPYGNFCYMIAAVSRPELQQSSYSRTSPAISMAMATIRPTCPAVAAPTAATTATAPRLGAPRSVPPKSTRGRSSPTSI